jgi:Flp pilus assembly protein TadG
MQNLLRCRRGSVAFATVAALVPLIGVVALGAEAGSWYVTRQNAQNAADAAAYSGALTLACTLAGSTCLDTQTVDYRGKEFAAQQGFCNAGDTTAYPGRQCATSFPNGISRTVQIASLTSWNGINGNFVQATVSQQQPAYLAVLLGLSTVNIPATAVAQVNQFTPNPPCILALTGSLSFQGSPNIDASNCGLASNDPANNAINFTGGGMTITPGTSISAAGGCTGSASFCNQTHLHTPPVGNPFAALDGALTALCGANPTLPAKCGLPVCPGSALVAYTAATKCTNDGITTKGNSAVTLAAGVYFISGTLTLKGGSSITGTGVTLILLPGATMDTKGGGTLTTTGPTTAPSTSSLPAAFQSYASLFQYMAIYDASATAVQFGGNSSINLTGNIYAPTASVTFQGNPTINIGNGKTCGELIAASVAFNGNATLDSSGCPQSQQVPNPPQYVQLVQ